MAKTRVDDFDRDVCLGAHPDVDGPCPHLAATDRRTGRSVIDRLAHVETTVLEAVTGTEQFACDICSCPLPNLGAMGVVPDDCVRLEQHDR